MHTVEYVDEVFEESNTGKWVSSSKTITDSLDGVSPGKYRVVVTDHAGNSRSTDIVVGGEPAEPVEFSIYVPSSIQVTVNEDGSATTNPEAPKIYNGVEALPICVTDIQVMANGEWSLVDYSTEFTDSDKDKKEIALSINGSPVSADGSVEVDRDAWMIPADGVKELNLTLKVPKQTQAQTLNNVFKIDFQADWYDASLVPGERHAVTLQPVEHATIKGTATMLYTDEYGRIPVLPRVIADDDYTFVRWEDEQGTAVSTGQVVDKDITIHPVLNFSGEITPELPDMSEIDSIVTLDADGTCDFPYFWEDWTVCFNLNHFTVNYSGTDTAFEIESTGKLLLRGENGGTIRSRAIGIRVKSGGELWIPDQNITVNSATYPLYVEAGAKVHLSGGTYSSAFYYPAIYVEDGDYAGLLAPEYAFFDEDGTMVDPADVESLSEVTVMPRY